MFASLSKTFIILFFFAVISAGSAWFFYEKFKNPLAGLSFEPESYGQNIIVQRFNEKGTLIQELSCPYIEIYNQKDKVVFYKPSVNVFTANQQPWQISADKAFATLNFEHILLENNVIFSQSAGLNNNSVTVLTSQLVLNTTAQTAYTDQPVTLVEEGKNNSKVTLQAKGVEADQKTGRIKLMSNIKIQYLPLHP